MNTNILRTYIRVVETQNLSRTAEECGISQPAVTKQIQTLEDNYGVMLLERAGRSLKPTEAGEILYHHAREIIKYVDKAEKALKEAEIDQRGVLSFGASTIPGQYILPSLIKEFKEHYPQLSISMDIADTEKIYHRIAERELDLGIVGGRINNRKVEGFRWLDDRFMVVLPLHHHLAGNYEITLQSLAREPWIFREKGSGTRRAIEELLASQGIRKDDLNICIEVGSTEAVLASVRAGMGVSIVSHWAVGSDGSHQGVKAVPIADSRVPRSFYVIYPKQKTRRKLVSQFIEFLKKAQHRFMT